VYIFGEPDWKPPRHPNLRSIELAPDFKLAREWFLIADSPTLQVALVARDEDGFKKAALDKRTFSALKTSDPEAVSLLANAIDGIIDWSIAA
jgi:DICT domain-containing protein